MGHKFLSGFRLRYHPRLELLEPRTVLSFLPPVPYTTGATPGNPDVADFNQDGKLDVGVATYFIGRVSILLGNGDGTLSPFKEYPTHGSGASSTETADMNNDGIPDIEVSNHGSASVSVLLGVGDGTFRAPIISGVPYDVNDLVVRDFNGDGFQDAAALSYIKHRVYVLIGNGDGTLEHVGTISTGQEPTQIAASDLNNDGTDDLAVANQTSNSFSVLLGNGNGTFKTKVDYLTGASYANGIAVGDFDNDGNPDVVVASTLSNRIGVFKGNGNGTFASPVQYRVRRFPTGLAVNDFNQDGFMDIAVSGQTDPTGAVTVLLNDGAGSFYVQSVNLMAQTFRLVSGDLNGDGYFDILASNAGYNRITVLINDGSWIPPLPINNPPPVPEMPIASGHRQDEVAPFNRRETNPFMSETERHVSDLNEDDTGPVTFLRYASKSWPDFVDAIPDSFRHWGNVPQADEPSFSLAADTR